MGLYLKKLKLVFVYKNVFEIDSKIILKHFKLFRIIILTSYHIENVWTKRKLSIL